MSIEEKPKLKLVGTNGNALALLGRARQVAEKSGWSKEDIKEYEDIAMSGDYNNLLQTLMEYFEVE